MGLSDLTKEAVSATLDEFDAVGRGSFLEKYGFGEAKDYYVVRNGRLYDSKAVAGVAHGQLPGKLPLRSDQFTGGAATVARQLRALGFRVPPLRSPPWVRDEVILACDLVVENGWQPLTAEDPRVIELSALLQRLSFHPIEARSLTFRNPNGVERKSIDIVSNRPGYPGAPTNAGDTDRQTLAEFLHEPEKMHQIAVRLREAVADNSVVEALLAPASEEDGSAPEGRLLQRLHFVRERDRTIRKRKIDDFLKSSERVSCEVCGFDFERMYGDRGRDYIEVHHVVPLHISGPTVTDLNDLVLLCSNCHRMIHCSTPWLTPGQLSELVQTKVTPPEAN